MSLISSGSQEDKNGNKCYIYKQYRNGPIGCRTAPQKEEQLYRCNIVLIKPITNSINKGSFISCDSTGTGKESYKFNAPAIIRFFFLMIHNHTTWYSRISCGILLSKFKIPGYLLAIIRKLCGRNIVYNCLTIFQMLHIQAIIMWQASLKIRPAE